jgi:hypothetical protein
MKDLNGRNTIKAKENFISIWGRWAIILEEIEFDLKVGNHPLTVDYEELTLTDTIILSQIKSGSRFFDFDILRKQSLLNI